MPAIPSEASAASWCAAIPRRENEAFERVTVPGDWHTAYRVEPGVIAIVEAKQFQEAISYLIIGTKRALLFDSGIGLMPLKPVVDALANEVSPDAFCGAPPADADTARFRARPRTVSRRIAPSDSIDLASLAPSLRRLLPAHNTVSADPARLIAVAKAATVLRNGGGTRTAQGDDQARVTIGDVTFMVRRE